MKRDEEAVSDIIGFILILGITILALAIITVFAQPMLDKSKNDITFSNMEQAFILLHSDINDIASGKSTIKTRDLNLLNGAIHFNPNATNITIESEFHPLITSHVGSIEYAISGLTVCLENGALISDYKNGSFVTSDPFIYIQNETDGPVTIINLIKLDGSEFSIGGQGIVRIIELKNFSESYVSQEQQNISIQIESPYADGWAYYLKKQGFNVTQYPNIVIAKKEGTKLRIFGTVIKMSNGKALPINSPEYSLSAVIDTPTGPISQQDIKVNATITNNGNQNMTNVNARLDFFSLKNYTISPPVTKLLGDIAVGSSKEVNWTVSSFSSTDNALFTVTVEGTGQSSWFHPTQYQGRSNKIEVWWW